MAYPVILYEGNVTGAWRRNGRWIEFHPLGTFVTRKMVKEAHRAYCATIINGPPEEGYDFMKLTMTLTVTEVLALRMQNPKFHSSDTYMYATVTQIMVHPQ